MNIQNMILLALCLFWWLVCCHFRLHGPSLSS